MLKNFKFWCHIVNLQGHAGTGTTCPAINVTEESCVQSSDGNMIKTSLLTIILLYTFFMWTKIKQYTILPIYNSRCIYFLWLDRLFLYVAF